MPIFERDHPIEMLIFLRRFFTLYNKESTPLLINLNRTQHSGYHGIIASFLN